jgi:L-seryl-tRNA(Ser) seleniumtransferase
LAGIARDYSTPLAVDLGSGTLVDMSRWGLPQEPTVSQTLSEGADLVAFSGDKLLGGPQCGIIAGRSDLIKRIKKNPLKRALRVDKFTLAALGAVLPLYAHPEKLPCRLPTYNYLTKTSSQIRKVAENLCPTISTMVEHLAEVSVEECSSQIGSGALPIETLPSAALRLKPKDTRGRAPEKFALSLRKLPVPVIGRVREGAVWLDLRCLDSGQFLIEQLACLVERRVSD